MRLAYVLDEAGCLQPQLVRGLRPVALVVASDASARLDAREELDACGYHVVTCPGPAVTHCLASVDATVAEPCRRADPGTTLVVLDAAASATALPEVYRAWFPLAEIRTTRS